MGGQVVSYISVKLERVTVAARSVETIGGVAVYGLQELESATTGAVDFVEAWRAAICLEMGGEEFEKFCLARHGKPGGRGGSL